MNPIDQLKSQLTEDCTHIQIVRLPVLRDGYTQQALYRFDCWLMYRDKSHKVLHWVFTDSSEDLKAFDSVIEKWNKLPYPDTNSVVYERYV